MVSFYSSALVIVVSKIEEIPHMGSLLIENFDLNSIFCSLSPAIVQQDIKWSLLH